MIISPPILKTPQGNTSDEQWLASLMPFSSRGGFPIASRMAWHGGQHIEHTDTGPHGEPVRAMADGVVVYKRAPSPDADKKPLAYQGATDNGCVVIKHNTEIGEGPDGQIEYYSIYMHLKEVFVKNKQPVNRKDSLGSVGSCNGKNAMHLEIICDDANLKKIVGRSTGKLDISKDGRDKIVYGDMHFYLPPGAPFYAAIASPQAPAGSGTPLHTSTVPLFITMRFEHGKCLLSTRQEDSWQEGYYIELGQALADSDDKYEYNLYSKAASLGDAFHIAPSAAYELLRFGRVINTDNEIPIAPGSIPHWHKINYPGGQGWVDLNATGVKKFSDADFPHWLGWTLIDDDPTQDSQCNSPMLEKWIVGNTGNKLTADALSIALGDTKIQSRFSRVICKFPTEWEKSQLDIRYGWLKQKSDVLDQPMTEDQYTEFKAYAEALCFWDEADLGTNSTHWHFHPRLFVEHFRKCNWIDKNEFLRVYPNDIQKKDKGKVQTAKNALTEAIREKYRRDICLTMRKYLINKTGLRMTNFFAQGAEESRTLTWMNESRSEKSCNDLYTGKLGNDLPGDGYKYRGRGIKQLTGKSNYAGYWVYRGKIKRSSFDPSWWSKKNPKRPEISDPDYLLTNTYATIDAGAWYWEAGPRRGEPRKNSTINKIIDEFKGDLESMAKTVCLEINGGYFGLENRQYHTTRISKVLMDQVL